MNDPLGGQTKQAKVDGYNDDDEKVAAAAEGGAQTTKEDAHASAAANAEQSTRPDHDENVTGRRSRAGIAHSESPMMLPRDGSADNKGVSSRQSHSKGTPTKEVASSEANEGSPAKPPQAGRQSSNASASQASNDGGPATDGEDPRRKTARVLSSERRSSNFQTQQVPVDFLPMNASTGLPLSAVDAVQNAHKLADQLMTSYMTAYLEAQPDVNDVYLVGSKMRQVRAQYFMDVLVRSLEKYHVENIHLRLANAELENENMMLKQMHQDQHENLQMMQQQAMSTQSRMIQQQVAAAQIAQSQIPFVSPFGSARPLPQSARAIPSNMLAFPGPHVFYRQEPSQPP